MFIGRSELTDANETTQEHLANQVAETEKVERDKKNTDPRTGGLFQGCFNRTTIPLYDNAEGVTRCPGCFWELEDGECTHCGYTLSDSMPDIDDDLQRRLMDSTFTEDEDEADFILRDGPNSRFEYNFHHGQPFMVDIGGDESVDAESEDDNDDEDDEDNDNDDEDNEDDEDDESDLLEDESIDSDDSEISTTTARRASSDHGSQTIDAESTLSVQELSSSAHSEADSDEEPIRRPVRRRVARPHQSRQRTSLDHRSRMTLPMFLLQASRRGNDPENALVIDDSSPPRPAARPRLH